MVCHFADKPWLQGKVSASLLGTELQRDLGISHPLTGLKTFHTPNSLSLRADASCQRPQGSQRVSYARNHAGPFPINSYLSNLYIFPFPKRISKPRGFSPRPTPRDKLLPCLHRWPWQGQAGDAPAPSHPSTWASPLRWRGQQLSAAHPAHPRLAPSASPPSATTPQLVTLPEQMILHDIYSCK